MRVAADVERARGSVFEQRIMQMPLTRRLCIAGVALIGAGCGGGTAAPSPTPTIRWSPAQVLREVTPGGFPLVAGDGSGNALAVWGDVEGLWAVHFDSGRGWGIPELVDRGILVTQPVVDSLSMNSSGAAVVGGRHFEPGAGSAWAIRFSPASGWGRAVRIDNGDPDSNFGNSQVAVAIDESGGALAIWTAVGVWTSRSVAGDEWEVPRRISRGPASQPRLAIDDDGTALSVWHEIDLGAAARFGRTTGWRTVAPFDATRVTFREPQLVAAAGGYACVWVRREDPPSTSGGTFVRRFETSGEWNAAVQLQQRIARCPALALDRVGDGIAVWTDEVFALWDSRIPARAAAGAAELLHAGAVLPCPAAAADPGGNVTVMFVFADGTRADVWSRRFVKASSTWSPPERIGDQRSEGEARFPRVAIDDNGNGTAIWLQFRGNRAWIWGGRFSVEPGSSAP